MIEFGKTLREAREAKGITISQIAETTHMMATIVRNLEEEDFSKIVAPIYGRGFVKLYCEAVGLDAKPLVDEFMAIYNGNRMPEIKERPVATAAEPPVPPSPIPEARPAEEVVIQPPPPPPPPEPAMSPEPIAVPEPVVVPEPVAIPTPPPQKKVLSPEPPPPDMDSLFAQTKQDANPQPPKAAEYDLFGATPPPPPPKPADPLPPTGGSRYAPPVRDVPKRRFTPEFSLPTISIPPNTWRLALLALVTAAIVALLCLGLGALYRATTDRPTDAGPKPAMQPTPPPRPTPAPVKTTPAPVEKKPAAAAPTKTSDQAQVPPSGRTPQKIPSLFID